MLKAKRVSDSMTILSEVMMPAHANHYGSVHGGTILKLVDEAAFVVATKHARRNVVLVSLDDVVFKHRVNIGDMISVKARLRRVGFSSMTVDVEIEAEELKEGRTVKVGSARIVMVALDERGKPTEVPRLVLTKASKSIAS